MELRRLRAVLIGCITLVTLSIPIAAQATSSAPSIKPDLIVNDTYRLALPPAQCNALRQNLGKPTAPCAVVETIHLSASRSIGAGQIRSTSASSMAPAATTYWYGYLQACGTYYSSGYCDPNNWWVNDYFNVTTSGSQAWNNGTPVCSANHTNVTWCSYANNGQSPMQEGFNFGNNGWARLDIYGDGSVGVRGSSYANLCGFIQPSAPGNPTPCP